MFATPRPLRAILRHLDSRQEVVAGLLMLVMSYLLGVLGPYLLALLIEVPLSGGRAETLLELGLIVLVVQCGWALGTYRGRLVLGRQSERFFAAASVAVLDHCLRLPPRVISGYQRGDLAARIFNDTSQAARLLQSVVPGLVIVATAVGGAGVVLLVMAPKLVFLALAPLPVVALAVLALRRRVARLSLRRQELLGKTTQRLFEAVEGQPTISLYGATERFVALYGQLAREHRQVQERILSHSSVLSPLVNLALSLISVVVLIVGGRWVLEGELQISALMLFFFYVGFCLRPLQSAVNVVFELFLIRPALERLDGLLSQPVEPHHPDDVRSILPMRLERVRHVFGEEQRGSGDVVVALDDVDLELGPGQRVAVLGPSGSGKSTLGRVAARLLEPQGGRLVVGEFGAGGEGISAQRRQIGYVGQEVFMFEATLRDNISFSAPSSEIEGERMEEVVRLARVDEILDRRGCTLDTVAGDRGLNLSGGQKKRIALARALLRQPSLLIVDQLASDLEAELNREIFEALRQRYPRMAILYLGHLVPPGLEPQEVHWMERGRLRRREAPAPLRESGGYGRW